MALGRDVVALTITTGHRAAPVWSAAGGDSLLHGSRGTIMERENKGERCKPYKAVLTY
jgi:hypothetical protein